MGVRRGRHVATWFIVGLSTVVMSACVADGVVGEVDKSERCNPEHWPGVGYWGPRIGEFTDAFATRGFDLSGQEGLLSLDDPVTDYYVNGRFGPASVSMFKGGQTPGCHSGVDLHRRDPAADDGVRSPVDGFLMASSSPLDPFYDQLLIWDSRSRLVVVLTHVVVIDELASAHSVPVPVVRGQRVGTLAPATIHVGPENEEAARHVHLAAFDGSREVRIDVLPYLAGYTDTIAPVIHDVYVLDECGNRHTGLIDGPMEIIARASDRGDRDLNDFGVSRIGYVLTDQDGTDLAVEPACDLRDSITYERREPSIPALMNVQAIKPPDDYSGDGWWYSYDGLSYGYSLGSLSTGADHRCEVREPSEVYFELPRGTTSLHVFVSAYDAHGNRATRLVKLAREAGGAVPGTDWADPSP